MKTGIGNVMMEIMRDTEGMEKGISMMLTDLTPHLEAYDVTSCLVHRRGELTGRYDAEDSASDRPMPINSCTKSVLSALVCIAMGKGLLPPADTRAIEFFPAMRQETDERKHRITLRHLLTMTAGFQWQEFGGLNSFPKMIRTPDWNRYVWEQPMAHEPGERFAYSSGVSQLIATMLAQAIEGSIADYAERTLFGPLGIERYAWKSDPQGIHTGGYGLELSARDLLSFGLLYLHRGVWNGEDLVPRELVDISVQPAIAVQPPERGRYGWHWWVDAAPAGSGGTEKTRYFYARGFAGQFAFVVPEAEAVVVFTRKRQRKGRSPHELFRQHIIGRLRIS